MKIYTKTGDKGETALYGGERVPKNHARVQAYGAVDELNAALGVARGQMGDSRLDAHLENIQNALFDVGADLATPNDSKYRAKVAAIDVEDIAVLEALIDKFDEELGELKNFILPGGDAAAAALHVARTITRRAERDVVTLSEHEAVNEHVGVYLNRLSDLLFTMARVTNMRMGVRETKWHVKGRERKL